MLAEANLAIYSTAKAGVLGLTRSLARELGGYNIRVNSVVPGWIMTQRQIDLWLTPEAEKDLLQRQCIKRKLYPDDVARLVLFLASDDSSGCTNQSYVIDGGRN
jgi:NAD(P)-dependent dehydrogenase (short-subunit alcohol dehydrogenase family)